MKVTSSLLTGLNLLFGIVHVIHGEAVTPNGEECSSAMNTNDGTCTVKEPQCKYYLAESSIPNSGFGVYTVEAIKEDEQTMKSGADAPSVLVIDNYHHHPNRLWSMANYFWSGEGFGQFECIGVEEYLVTFGTSCNFHTYLKNLRPKEDGYSDTITPRAESSPGIGAYSYYGGSNFRATRDIAAGEELFTDYGEDWIERRPHLHHIPRKDDYDTASTIVMKLIDGLGDDDINDSFLRTVKEVVGVFSERIATSLIPTNKDDFKDLIKRAIKSSENNTDVAAANIAKQLAFNSLIPRDIDWIKSEGQCLDNLVKKKSTIPHAGNGAFAQRFIAKGETVVPAPLLHIMDGNESTLMYGLKYDDFGKVINDDNEDDAPKQPYGKQLILNYCYGHDESSMLLCPQTNSMLINHCSTRHNYGGECEKSNNNEDESLRGPNAIIRWATEWDPDTEKWLKMSLEEIRAEVEKGKRGLSFEVIATRDIYPGDEVLLDYGEEWEADWEEHVANWEPLSADDYTPLDEMRKSDYFKTLEELEDEPLSSNIMTVCHYWMEEGEVYDEEVENEKVEEEWNSDGSEIAASPLKSFSYWPCDVLSRETDKDGNDIYEVEIFQRTYPGAPKTVWFIKGYRRILQNMTKDTIKYATVRYMSDQHLSGIFRSPLRIPDAMFPKAWRDQN